ncbi:MAG: YgiQ family radical SAM protein [bacterium]|nr:YgiQ family radical SAM protein [bacterium]
MSTFDIIFVLPYLFSDHPSFPEGILKRSLEAEGFKVGVIKQPAWKNSDAFKKLGAPRLFFAIIPGPVDSMLLNFTSTGKRRTEDLYQMEGKAFFDDGPKTIKAKIRPDRAVVVFANRLREAYKHIPIVIGGVEAALRRYAHYDYREDKIKRSILLDSRADILVTGMGEKTIVSIAHKAKAGATIKELDLPGTARVTKDIAGFDNYVFLPTMADILGEKEHLMTAALKIEQARINREGIIQPHEGRFVIEHPPQQYTAKELDSVYSYDYQRRHPGIKPISPALQMNLFSVTSHRGCGGGCTFCSISLHEGKRIISRSRDSILTEIEKFNSHPRWKGVVSDIGGASAEFYGSDCSNPKCKRPSCLVQSKCKTISTGGPFLKLLRDARKIKGVKQIFLGSGMRYDLVLRNPQLLEEILVHHTGRFLRVAPEHTQNSVLELMRKPGYDVFGEFVRLFKEINLKLKRKIELAPYLIVGHPGELARDVSIMADRLKKLKVAGTDAQIFTPIPGTIATAMYYSGVNTKFKTIPVERSMEALMRRKRMLTK